MTVVSFPSLCRLTCCAFVFFSQSEIRHWLETLEEAHAALRTDLLVACTQHIFLSTLCFLYSVNSWSCLLIAYVLLFLGNAGALPGPHLQALLELVLAGSRALNPSAENDSLLGPAPGSAEKEEKAEAEEQKGRGAPPPLPNLSSPHYSVCFAPALSPACGCGSLPEVPRRTAHCQPH